MRQLLWSVFCATVLFCVTGGELFAWSGYRVKGHYEKKEQTGTLSAFAKGVLTLPPGQDLNLEPIDIQNPFLVIPLVSTGAQRKHFGVNGPLSALVAEKSGTYQAEFGLTLVERAGKQPIGQVVMALRRTRGNDVVLLASTALPALGSNSPSSALGSSNTLIDLQEGDQLQLVITELPPLTQWFLPSVLNETNEVAYLTVMRVGK